MAYQEWRSRSVDQAVPVGVAGIKYCGTERDRRKWKAVFAY